MDVPTEGTAPARSDGVLVAETVSHGGLLGLVAAAVAAVLAILVVRVGKRRAQ